MKCRTLIRRAALAAAASVALTVASLSPGVSGAAEAESGLAGSDLYMNPYSATLERAQSLSGQARADAQLLGSMPSAEWITGGWPNEAEARVDQIVDAASSRDEMPVIVAYNLPFRDCAQYSAGGAGSTAEYKAWIDGLVAGIGDRPATVILEPDGLGVIPWYAPSGGELEWCRPAEISAETAASERFDQLNYAVDALKTAPNTSVYLDGTGPNWLSVGDITERLLRAGVLDADGFFLNVSNYQFTGNARHYGTWVSSCIAYVTEVSAGAFADCGAQYRKPTLWSGGAPTPWQNVDLSPYGEWASDAAVLGLNTGAIDSRFGRMLGEVEPTTHFVIDTSRSGQGPWEYPDDVYPEPEDWCNPPDRGTGPPPSTETGDALVDAHLWIKHPGESDGSCHRGTEGPADPVRGKEDPAAGEWFVDQARELIRYSDPPLAPLECDVEAHVRATADGYVMDLAIENLGGESVSPWTLSWALQSDQAVTSVSVGEWAQRGPEVTITSTDGSAGGDRATVTVVGTGDALTPWLFHFNGKPCTSL